MNKKFGVFVFLGLLIGSAFGGLFGSANSNPLAGLVVGALAGVFFGWYAAAIEQQNNK